jgi:putative ABC transport system substrate-binding protein
MSYSASFPDLFRRAADYVDRILRGAKPADLPVQQPTQFELVINSRPLRSSGSRCRRRCSAAPTR